MIYRFIASVHLFLIVFSVCADQDKPHNLSICTIFKNNAPYLKEWIEYHKMVGVDHFFLYNNSSTDNFLEVLTPYIQDDTVTLVNWPNRDAGIHSHELMAWVKYTQVPAYYHSIRLAKNKTKWLAIIDTDEFIVPVVDKNLTLFLERYNDYPGISIRWQVYGTSNVQKILPGQLLIEQLVWKALPNHFINTLQKSIIQPSMTECFLELPHSFIYKNNRLAYESQVDEIRINHYINRTIEFYHEHKIAQKETMDNVKLDAETQMHYSQLYNDVEDRIMDYFIPELKRRMGFIE